MIRQDIRAEAEYINTNNDIEMYDSDVDHIEDTIAANPGEWKEHPSDGVGIASFLNSSGQEATIARKVIIQLQSDLYDCDKPTVSFDSSGELIVNPNIEITA